VPLIDPLWRSSGSVAEIVGFHRFRYLWRGCRSAGWFAYRPDIVVTKGAAGNAQPAKCERCRHKSYKGKPKLSRVHHPNHWRERTVVARSTLCVAAPPVERHSTRMNGSEEAWPWSCGFPTAAHGRQPKRRCDEPSVAATVHEAHGRTEPNVEPKRLSVASLNTQSPSQRSDGDCVLRLCTPVASIQRLI
jgi:hypothetical protein